MSLLELKEQIALLTPAERAELRADIEANDQPPVRSATPAMLAERRSLSEEVMNGKWFAELAGFEGNRACDRERAARLHGAWSD